MADETNATAPGSATSEGAWNKVIQIACGVVMTASVALTALQEQFPSVVWIQLAAMAVAGIVSVLTQLGYLKSRTIIKAAMIASDAPTSPK